MNILDFKRKKKLNNPISMLTCYDYPSAQIVAQTNVDVILIGDSVAMMVHGHPTTLMATMDMMCLHTEAVARGAGDQFIVADLPFLGHRISKADTFRNVQRLFQAGAEAIKLEGGDLETCHRIEDIVQAGLPVMGHLGLTPQAVHQLGGYKVQGRNEASAEKIKQQAKLLEQAGCFAIVLECMPAALAQEITASLTIPTIGIGAGIHTDGQILVWHDVLGLQENIQPKFSKQYLKGQVLFVEAINQYIQEIHAKNFPSTLHSYS